MTTPRSLSAALLAAAALALAGAGCGPAASAAAPDTTARDLRSVEARLHGAWRLQRFVPEAPLEPMMKMLVESQFNVLVVRFDGQRFAAESPGIKVDRVYRIEQPSGDRFRMISFDDDGVAYDTVCTFQIDGTLEINSWTQPWRGVANLVKISANAAPIVSPMQPLPR